MPQILQEASVDAARSSQEQFVELMCADAELVRAEFDAIIAAEWSQPPPDEPDSGPPPEPPPRGPRRLASGQTPGLPNQKRRTGISASSRQRSPPRHPAPPWQRQPRTREAGDGHQRSNGPR